MEMNIKMIQRSFSRFVLLRQFSSATVPKNNTILDVSRLLVVLYGIVIVVLSFKKMTVVSAPS